MGPAVPNHPFLHGFRTDTGNESTAIGINRFLILHTAERSNLLEIIKEILHGMAIGTAGPIRTGRGTGGKGNLELLPLQRRAARAIGKTVGKDLLHPVLHKRRIGVPENGGTGKQ